MIIVFARTPAYGEVKTRLAAAIGDDAALRLHEAFLADTLDHARATGRRVVLARTPGPAFPHVAHDERLQQGDDFATRFDHALADADGPCILIGSDTPHLTSEAMDAAFAALDDDDAVIGPAPRGGFHLLGFRGGSVPVGEVFERRDQVAALHHLCARHGLRTTQVPALDDIDEPNDLARLARLLADRPDRAPHTHAALQALGLTSRDAPTTP